MYIKKYQKDKTTLYMFQGYLGTDQTTGNRIRVTRKGFKSQKECELEFYRLKLQYEAGDHYNKTHKYTYQEVYELWLDIYKTTVKESTLNKTLNIFELHVLPIFGNKYIDMIKVTHCQDAVKTWFKTMKNYRAINNYCGLVFRHAMKLELISSNPTKLVTMPNQLESVEDEPPGNYYNIEELKQFLNAPELLSNPKWAALFRTLAFTGCRKGEVLVLTWNDVNFKDNTITINKTLTLGLGNRLIVQTPKTKTSKRVLPMDPGTMSILKAWKLQQNRDMLKLGFNTMNREQLLFPNLSNEYISPQKVGQKIETICKKNDMKVITPHGFRHTHCSILFEAGASVKEVQDRLGHSDIKTTMNIYAHVSEKKREETALKFADYVQI